jgi:uncharacterized protein (TIGR03437 family)
VSSQAGQRCLILGLLFVSAASSAQAEGFIVPRSGNLYVRAVGGSAGGTSQFGLGTSQNNFTPLLSGLPGNPSPSGEVFAGLVSAGQTVHFGMFTVFGSSAYAFSNATDAASQGAFWDTNNSLGMGGSIIEQTSSNTWLLHLDDARSYQFDDDDNDVLIALRLDSGSGGGPPAGGPTVTLDFEPPLSAGLAPMSFIQGSAVPFQARITDEFASVGVLMENAALVNLGVGHAPSGSNGIGPISPNGTLDYASPITFTFVSPNDGVSPASTDYFRISGDVAGGSGNTVTVRAYSVDNRLVGSVSQTESNPVVIELQSVGSFQKVVVQSTLASQATGGIAFDLVRFGSLTPNPSQPPRPAVTAAGIVSAASLVPGLVPGGLVSVFGTGLSTGVAGTELPGGATAHKGTVVLIGGWPAPLLSVTNQNGQEQINLQVPFELVPGTSTTVQVVNNGQRTSVEGVPVYATKPGIFEVPLGPGGLPLGAVIHPNGSIVTTANAAWRGEVVALFLTGLGGLAPYVGTGQVGPVPPATTQMPVTVLIDTFPARVLFSGYAPGFVGLYQVNFEIPSSLASGLIRTLLIQAGGNVSQESFLPVQ